jgi:acyl-CoA synthetase (AMP-forming)/AMP-acid ligase II
MDERGYCKIEGRLKDMIIRGGENIYPREIEELLFQHPSVGEVAVVGLPDERMGEEVGAFLRPAPGQTLDKDVLFAYLREHLSPQKTPRFWYEVESTRSRGRAKSRSSPCATPGNAAPYTEQMSAPSCLRRLYRAQHRRHRAPAGGVSCSPPRRSAPRNRAPPPPGLNPTS